MKRNMDLIRELLLKLESIPARRGDVFTIPPDADEVAVPGYDVDHIAYHLSLIREAGLIELHSSQPMDGITFPASVGTATIFSTRSATQRFGSGLNGARRRPAGSQLTC
jgi:hypothetical protein